MGGLSCLHDDGSDEIGEKSKGEPDSQDWFLIKEKACQKNWRNKKSEDYRKVVKHDMKVFGGEKARAHRFTMGGERALSN